MIWRLTYCNKEGIEARLDIIKGASTPVEVIEGTATPFILNYKMDKSDKSGHVMSSSADISIFETPTFNIDNLKTSSETEIKVEYYINGVLDWSGFVIPDFFSKTIGTPATVEMVASDRLGTLKGVTLEDLNQYESMRDLAVKCLAKTGLTLPLYTMADFGNNGTTNAFFKALGLSGRLSDTKGRNISCYDILKSILVASNSKLVQQSGAWYIVNKWQHEQGVGNLFSTLTASTAYSEQTVSFSDVHAGARRTIIPVAATTGVFHEFGGGRSYPENYTAGTLTEPLWTAYNDTEQLPLLQHVTRQKSRMFSIAHNMISASIDVATFKPLNIFVDCNAVNPRHVVVSASYDFLRSEVEVELEQIAYATLDVREFIYSYFGEGESGISSVGGIAGGGGGTGGGGMTSEQLAILNNLASWWKLDEENDAIYSEKSIYSLKGVSALGYGDGGGSGGGVDMLDSWANYTEAKADYYAPASLLVPFRSDTLSRLASLEAGGGAVDIDIETTGLGNAVTGVSKSGNTLTFAKSSTFALSTHNHDTLYKPIGYVPSWSEIIGKPPTFAPSAHTHTIANVTGLQSALNAKQNTLIAGANITISGNTISASGGMSSVAWGDITDKPTTFAPSAHTHTIANVTGLQSALNGKEPSFTKNTAFNKNFGTASGTVAQGNDSRILNGQTAYGWGNHASAGYALNSALTAHTNNDDNPHAVTTAQIGAVDLTTTQTITGAKTFSALLTASVGINTPKVIFAAAGWSLEQVGTELQMKHNGVVKQRMLSDGTILATGGITALATS
jgi:hypothetical protein